ncbi:hypothetical protein FH972_025719 [Carpinus fangiana]|uniref:Uncharacterized protein n=1 Tax=Carpinus fangiana TaxID=176857 RepID=A0A5N6L1T7_9ROSI|nr:hypothetical protein FH972_025719 [Carpinus fangiana]
MASLMPVHFICPKNLPQVVLRCQQRRCISVKSTYNAFPATLVRHQTHRHSSLFPASGIAKYPAEDGVKVSSTGHVCTGAALEDGPSSGALFMPNTFLGNELMRRRMDEYFDESEEDNTVSAPVAVSVANEFNDELDKFYSESAKVTTLEEWVEAHDYGDAASDSDSSAWMGQ